MNDLHIKNLLEAGREQLGSLPSYMVDVRAILCHFLSIDHSYLLTHEDEVVDSKIIAKILKAFEQRKNKTPLAYILGYKEFFGRDFFVNRHTLIPRPETEELIEYALTFLEGNSKVLDIGTGSGCMAITLKKEKKDLEVFASDISKEALSMAKKNAKNLEASISFFESDLLASKELQSQAPFFLITANLPYVRDDAQHHSIEQEPNSALFSGPDGLDHYRALSAQTSKDICSHLLLEIDDAQGDLIADIFPQAKNIKIIKDLAGLNRIAHIEF